VQPDDWFLTAEERGNPSTGLDRRRGDGKAWTDGNRVRVLIHGAEYFPNLYETVCTLENGDWVHFTDWEGDPDERLAGPGTEVSRVFPELVRRGIHVRGLSGDRILARHISASRRTRSSSGRSTNPAARSCSTSASVAEEAITRSSCWCAAHLVRTTTSPSSGGSICATAGTTGPATRATRRSSTSTRDTTIDRHGTTFSSASRARRSATWRTRSANAGGTPRRSTIETRCAWHCVTSQANRVAPRRCRPRGATPPRPDRTPCR
jgi:hypothetical protein